MDKYYKYTNDLTWLSLRRNFITASDFVDVYKLKKKPTDEQATKKLKLTWLDKHSRNHEDPVVITGAAARGHCLEPYAIKEYNAIHVFDDVCFYHWDDRIIMNGRQMGWSPDGCDVKQQSEYLSTAEPKHIIEVKCYGNSHHFECCEFTDKKDMPERLQIAWAMAASPSIEDAVLLFYNPDSLVPYKEFVYTREDLSDEIDLANHCADLWVEINNEMMLSHHPDEIPQMMWSEDEIYKELVEEWE